MAGGPKDGFTSKTDELYGAAHTWRGLGGDLGSARQHVEQGLGQEYVFGPVAQGTGVAAKHQGFCQQMVDALAKATSVMDDIAASLEATAQTYDAADRRSAGLSSKTASSLPGTP